MPERFQNSEFIQFFIKVLIPALFGVGIKIAIEMKKDKTKVSLMNVGLSMFVGVAGAYICSDIVKTNFPTDYQPAIIAFIAIISDKVAEWLIYEWKVDVFLTSFTNGLFDWISITFKRGK